MKILLVEDDYIQAKKLSIDIRDIFCNNIDISYTCDSAINMCKRKLYDYIFCDIQLPDNDGIYFLSKIANIQFDANIIIMSSGSHQVLKLVEQISSLLNFKTISRIDKPYSIHELRSVIIPLEDQRNIEFNIQYSNDPVFTEVDVIDAISQGRVFVHYQPQVDTSNHRTVGFEALARWDHPEHGIIPAGRFVCLIESQDVFVSLFRTVLDKSLLGSAAFPNTVSISINITPNDLAWPGLYDEVVSKCNEYNFDFHRLVLELTESHVYHTDVVALLTLSRLKLLGVKLAIDDLGSGYSSLLKLTQLPFDELKIDRGLIVDIENDSKKRIVVQLLFNMAAKLNLTCVVEGIEHESTLDLLQTMGSFVSQGYLTGKPQSLNSLSRSLAKDFIYNSKFPIHCLIIDEHPMSAEALVRAFSNEEQVHTVSSTTSIYQAINYIRDRSCNLLLIDIELRNDSEFDMTRIVTNCGFQGKVIFMINKKQYYVPLSNIESDLYVLNKNDELGSFIHKAIDIFNGIGQSEDQQSRLLRVAQLLSKREVQVLDLIMKGKTNKMIARLLDISEKTVSTYKSRILEKLNVDNITDIYRLDFDNFIN